MATVVMPLRQAQPQGIDMIQLSYLSWLESQENERAQKYAMFRAYYEGDHATQLTKRMRKFLELTSDQDFSLNVCPIVVDSLAEKLKVAGFEAEQADESQDQPDIFREWWRRNRMDGQQTVVHLAAIRDGDTYLLVEWDNEQARPRFTQENAYDGTQGMHIVYSDERRVVPVVAIKRWILTSGVGIKTRRTNLYYPDRIEKYSDGGGGSTWQPYEEDGQPWPIPWTYAGQPLGIPVVHFRNKDQGYSYGESELEDVVPIQNGANKTFIDLLAAADTTGFRLYTMTGGNPSEITVAPGSWLYATDSAARIGALDPADLDGLIALKDSIIADAAKITRTPLSYFQLSGQVAAAGTLKEQRSGIISKARDRQVVFGNSWEDAMYLGRRLHNVFGPGGMDETVEVSTVWNDDEKPDQEALANTVNLLNTAAAASTEQKVRILHSGWNDEQVAAEVALIQAESGALVPSLPPFATAPGVGG